MTIYKLYVKTHNKTGLKYLGYTGRKDAHKYLGSGTYWKRHLKKHGKDYITDILLESENLQDITDLGVYYSQLWDVVSNNSWANLCIECGDGGPVGVKRSDEYRAKRSGPNNPAYGKPSPFKGQKHTETAIEAMKAKVIGRVPHNKGQKMSAEFCQKISDNHHDVKGENNPMFGKSHSDHTKMLIAQKRLGTKASLESRAKQSAARKGKPWSEARRAAQEAKKLSKSIRACSPSSRHS